MSALSTTIAVTPQSATATSLVINAPACNAGHMLVLGVLSGQFSFTPSGWTQVSAANSNLGVYTKTAGSSETSYTISFSGPCAATAVAASYPSGTVVSSSFPAHLLARLTNNAEGGSNGVQVTTANSGGLSGNAFDSVLVGVSAVLAFDNTRAAHGILSYQVSTPAGGAQSYVQWSTSMGSQAQVWFRLYLYFTANPANNVSVWRVLQGATVCASLRISTSGKLSMLNSASSVVTTSAASIPLNAWFRVEGFVLGAASTGQLEVKLFSTPDSVTPTETNTSSAAQTTVGPMDTYRAGVPATSVSIGPFWMDDVGLSSAGYLGPVVGGVTYSPAFPAGVTSAQTVMLFAGALTNLSDPNPGSGCANLNPTTGWTQEVAPIGPSFVNTSNVQVPALGLASFAGSTTAPVLTSTIGSDVYAGYLVTSITGAQPSWTTVTATGSGQAGAGMALTVKVITGATGSPGATIAGAAQSGAPRHAITPSSSNSWVYGSVYSSVGAAFTAGTGTTFSQNFADTSPSAAFGTFRSGLTTASTPMTLGGTGPASSAIDIALAEFPPGGSPPPPPPPPPTVVPCMSTAPDIHSLAVADRTTAALFYSNSASFGIAQGFTPADLLASPVQDGFKCTPILKYDSYALFQSHISSGAIKYPYQWVLYDNEVWSLTPVAEQNDPWTYMANFISLAHANGYKVMCTPARDLINAPASVNPPHPGESDDAWYLRTNLAGSAAASGANIVSVQTQADTLSISAFDSLYNGARSQVRAVSSTCKVWAGVSTHYGTAQQMAAAAQSISPDGIWVNMLSNIPLTDAYLKLMVPTGASSISTSTPSNLTFIGYTPGQGANEVHALPDLTGFQTAYRQTGPGAPAGTGVPYSMCTKLFDTSNGYKSFPTSWGGLAQTFASSNSGVPFMPIIVWGSAPVLGIPTTQQIQAFLQSLPPGQRCAFNYVSEVEGGADLPASTYVLNVSTFSARLNTALANLGGGFYNRINFPYVHAALAGHYSSPQDSPTGTPVIDQSYIPNAGTCDSYGIDLYKKNSGALVATADARMQGFVQSVHAKVGSNVSFSFPEYGINGNVFTDSQRAQMLQQDFAYMTGASGPGTKPMMFWNYWYQVGNSGERYVFTGSGDAAMISQWQTMVAYAGGGGGGGGGLAEVATAVDAVTDPGQYTTITPQQSVTLTTMPASGSLLVASVVCGTQSIPALGPVGITVSDSSGLIWTELIKASGVSYAGIWFANVP